MSWSLLCPISIPIHLDGLDYTSVHQWLLCQQALDSGDIAQFQRLRAPVDMSTSDASYQLTVSPLLRDRLRYVTQVFTDIPAGKLPPFDKMGWQNLGIQEDVEPILIEPRFEIKGFGNTSCFVSPLIGQSVQKQKPMRT